MLKLPEQGLEPAWFGLHAGPQRVFLCMSAQCCAVSTPAATLPVAVYSMLKGRVSVRLYEASQSALSQCVCDVSVGVAAAIALEAGGERLLLPSSEA